MKKSGAELLVQGLKRNGVERIFTLVGDHISNILRFCGGYGIQLVEVRHEASIVHMAEAWATFTRAPAVCLSTSGPGAANMAAGVAHVFASGGGAPLIVLTGQIHETNLGRDSFQELDIESMYRPITKWSQVVRSPERVLDAVDAVFREALAGHPGPAHLNLPSSAMAAEAEAPGWLAASASAPDAWKRFVRHPAIGDAELEDIVGLLLRARRPALIAGAGVWWSRGESALARFVETTRIPCFTADLGHGCLSDDHPLCFGRAEAISNPVARLLTHADVVLVIGSRIDFHLSFGDARVLDPDAKVVHIDLEARYLGKNREVAIGVVGEARGALEQLSARVAAAQARWTESPLVHELRAAAAERDQRFAALSRPVDDTIHPVQLHAGVMQLLDDDAIVGVDYGNLGCWIRSCARARHGAQVMRWGMSSLGLSIPWGVAAKLANPDKQVVVFLGDGAFGFYPFELATAVRYKLPVLLIVGNDAGWGYEVLWQKHAYKVPDPIACDLGFVRYDLVAAALGAHGELVSHPDELAPAVQRALASGLPACINVKIGQAQADHVKQIPEMWGPGGSERRLLPSETKP